MARRIILVVSAVVLVGVMSSTTAEARPVLGTAAIRRSTNMVASRATPAIRLRPVWGPAGASVGVKGSGFAHTCMGVRLTFIDANGVSTWLGDPIGSSFRAWVVIPLGAAVGAGTLSAENWLHYDPRLHGCALGGLPGATATFTVIGCVDHLDRPVTRVPKEMVKP
jgi:hypothetical protein